MTFQTTTTVMLDPVKDADVILLYEKNRGWKKKSECTICITFESESPLYVSNDAFYLPHEKGEYK